MSLHVALAAAAIAALTAPHGVSVLPAAASVLADVNATDVYMQFQLGWMADPLYFGDYPAVMRASQPHLPKFKDVEKKLLAGSLDFFALNYYTSHFVAAAPAGAPKSQVGLVTHESCCHW